MDGLATTTGVSNSPETAKNFMLNSSASVTQVGMPTPSSSQFQIPLIKMKAKGLKNNNKMYLRTAGKQIASPKTATLHNNQATIFEQTKNSNLVSTIKEENSKKSTTNSKTHHIRLKVRKTPNTSQPSSEFKKINRVEQINDDVITNLQKAIET